MTLVFATIFLFIASLQVVSAAEWSAEYGALPVVVYSDQEVTPRPLKVTGSFVEGSDRNAMPGEALLLCKTPEGPCLEPEVTTQTLYLRHQGELKAGIYAGQIIVQSEAERSGAKSLTVYVSSSRHRFWGKG